MVSFLERGHPRSRRSSVPAAFRGVRGRPTVVSNVETLARAALVGRFGAPRFRRCGSAPVPGSSLVTLVSGLASPAALGFLAAPSFSEVFAQGAVTEPPEAMLAEPAAAPG